MASLSSSLGKPDSCFLVEPSADAGQTRPWLHVLSHLHPKYGGVSAVVPQLNSAIAESGEYSIRLAGFCQTGEEYTPVVDRSVAVSHVPLGRQEWRTQPSVRDEFSKWVADSSGVHIHGLWQQSTAVSARAARAARKPYVVSAHGMLEPWALHNKRWKKRLYLALVERTNLRGADCLHALTHAEVSDYRELGLRNPIAVIPNGVVIPDHASPELFLSQFPELGGKRLLLFLGRLHFKKGLDLLCRAWSRIADQWPDTQLVLAGPDFEGTRAQLDALVSDLQLSRRVTFTGMLSGAMKWSALAASEFFVLPSYSEGLSVSVLEAMGMGRPVLITENCHLPEVVRFGCGTVIRTEVSELEKALDAMLTQSPAESQGMGHRGQEMVRTRYNWTTIGRQMASVYRWIEGGALPQNVEIDQAGASR